MKLPYRILVLDDDANALSGMVEILGMPTTSSPVPRHTTPRSGCWRSGPTICSLPTSACAASTALNLARQCNIDHPDMAIMIITGYDEPMMEIEAGRYDAEFLRKPIHPAEFLKKVAQCLSRACAGSAAGPASASSAASGSWPTASRRRWSMSVTAGLQLEMPKADDVPASFDVEVAGIGLHLTVDIVWARLSRAGDKTICGAALATDASPGAPDLARDRGSAVRLTTRITGRTDCLGKLVPSGRIRVRWRFQKLVERR